MNTTIEFIDEIPKPPEWISYDKLLKQSAGFFEIKDCQSNFLILNEIGQLISVVNAGGIVVPVIGYAWKKAMFRRLPQKEAKITIKLHS